MKFEHDPSRAISAKPRLAIRPEELHIGTGEGRNALRGRVESVLFLGSVVRMRVDLGGAMVSADLFNERRLVMPHTGDEVVVSFPEHACWLV